MKLAVSLKCRACIPVCALLAVLFLASPPAIQADSPGDAVAAGQELFDSPNDAVTALRAAVSSDNQAALLKIFGPEYSSLKTGDKVQDANNTRRFADAMTRGCNLVDDSDSQITIEVGTNLWPMPIPLVRTNGQWYFDTAAGRQEIIDRHIGKDELTAIGVCRDFVTAERQYAALNGGVYAQKFKSSPGKHDGLYWPAAEGEPPSPFGALVAEAQAEGYGRHHGGGPHPFHGYYFRILTRQGDAAPGGKMNDITHGALTKGFALVAYPENWGQSGIMTFIVNQDGTVFQQDFGTKTGRIGARMKEYNPDSNWSVVHDQGITNAASGQ